MCAHLLAVLKWGQSVCALAGSSEMGAETCAHVLAVVKWGRKYVRLPKGSGKRAPLSVVWGACALGKRVRKCGARCGGVLCGRRQLGAVPWCVGRAGAMWGSVRLWRATWKWVGAACALLQWLAAVGAGAAGCVGAALNGGRWMLFVGALCLRCGGRGARAGRAPAILCLWLGFRLGFRLPGLCLWGAGACAVWCHCRVLRITFGGGHVSKCCLDISVWFEFTPVWRARAWVFVGRCAGRRGVVDLGAAEPFRLWLWLWLGLFLW